MARPLKPWPQRRPAIRFIENIERDENEPTPRAVNVSANKSQSSTSKTSKWWSLISSVLKLPSRGQRGDRQEDDDTSSFIIKRCASFTGILKRSDAPNHDNDNEQPNKRRRTNTFNGPLNNTASTAYRRIESRQPISRLRADD